MTDSQSESASPQTFDRRLPIVAVHFMRRHGGLAAVIVCAGFVISGWLPAMSSEVTAQASRPNIVLIFPDNLGWGEVGAYGASAAS